MTLPPIIIVLMRQLELRRKLMCISLHLVGLSLILWAMAKLWMSEATTLSKLGEFLGIISRALVSSTYLMRSRQSDSSLFVITVKRITPSLVPWGTPPFSVNQSDRVLPILTACLLLSFIYIIALMIPPERHTCKTETQKPILGEHYSNITKYITTFTIWKSQYYFLNVWRPRINRHLLGAIQF